MKNNYFFIDGSALLADITKYISKNPSMKGKKLDPVKFSLAVFNSGSLVRFHGGAYRRTVFYFVKNDKRVEELISLPDSRQSDLIEDLQIKYCGKRIPNLRRAASWLSEKKAPNYVLDSLHRSEKAVDTQICCDAMGLIALDKLDRLFLYSNDYDFFPLCQSIKSFGANINAVRLPDNTINKDLVSEFDGYYAFKKHEIEQFMV